MSAILKTFSDHMIHDKTTWWLILECGHWCHWTGDKEPKADADVQCPNCKPVITVTHPGPSVVLPTKTEVEAEGFIAVPVNEGKE